MKKMTVIGALVVVVTLAGVAAIATHKATPAKTKSNTTTSSANAGLSSTSMTPSFMINANDTSADHEQITVKKGSQVSLMFMVQTSGTYHGGLQFVSTDPPIDSGAIATGDSKMVTFTATKSFSFQPYWYQSQVKKDYLITVTVTD